MPWQSTKANFFSIQKFSVYNLTSACLLIKKNIHKREIVGMVIIMIIDGLILSIFHFFFHVRIACDYKILNKCGKLEFLTCLKTISFAFIMFNSMWYSKCIVGENIDEVLQIVSENYEKSFRCAIKPVEVEFMVWFVLT